MGIAVTSWGFPSGAVIKNPPANAGDAEDMGLFDPWVARIPWSRKWQPTPVFLPGKFMDRGTWQTIYSPWGRKDLNMLSMYMCACTCIHTHTHTHTELLPRVIVRLNKVKHRKCSE